MAVSVETRWSLGFQSNLWRGDEQFHVSASNLSKKLELLTPPLSPVGCQTGEGQAGRSLDGQEPRRHRCQGLGDGGCWRASQRG